ncbi:hypothetical protein [Carboxylicivirga sp. RSCT41]|uniref:hypothetical protein n=1 Tax=Carboxylicivirga agarovorans TaxID=3417570 RepID=UPI003D331F20
MQQQTASDRQGLKGTVLKTYRGLLRINLADSEVDPKHYRRNTEEGSKHYRRKNNAISTLKRDF